MPVSEEMKLHLQRNTHLGIFMKITNKSGDIMRVWNGTRTKIYQGETYYAFPLAPSQLQTSNGLKADNMEAVTVFSGIFNAATLRNRKWQNARVEYQILDYKNFGLGFAERRLGFIGETTVSKYSANIELKSLTKKLSEPTGLTFQEDCNVVELGDNRCKVDLDGDTATGLKIRLNAHVVAPVLNKQQFSVEFDEDFYSPVPGLRGSYYTGQNFDYLQLQRIDRTVDFDYGLNAPAFGMPVDNFSIRWEGFVTSLYSETYTFSVEHDDGIRLYVNDMTTPLVDYWSSLGTHTGKLALTAGEPTAIKLEFKDEVNVSKVKLRWSSSSQSSQIIPATALTPPTISTIPDNFYQFGKIEFLSGANMGSVQQIAVNAGTGLTLLLPMYYTPALGDEVLLTAGCSRKIAMCRDLYANAENNRSFFPLPGKNKLTFPDR